MAALMGFGALCVALGLGYTLVVATAKRDWRQRHWTDWDELGSRGLYVWIGGWFTLLPIYYLSGALFGTKRIGAYTGYVWAHITEPSQALQAGAVLILAPALYGSLLAAIAWCTWTTLRATVSKQSEYAGHFAASALFGYLGLPLLLAGLGVSFERGLLP